MHWCLPGRVISSHSLTWVWVFVLLFSFHLLPSVLTSAYVFDCQTFLSVLSVQNSAVLCKLNCSWVNNAVNCARCRPQSIMNVLIWIYGNQVLYKPQQLGWYVLSYICICTFLCLSLNPSVPSADMRGARSRCNSAQLNSRDKAGIYSQTGVHLWYVCVSGTQRVQVDG